LRRLFLIIARKCNLQDLEFGSKLKKAGFEVGLAFSEKEAFKMMKKCSVDLAVIVNNGDKEESRKFLQQIQQISDVPVTLFRKNDNPEEIAKWLDSGADFYFTQPLNILEVEARIKSILRCLSRKWWQTKK
jgi:DNA-binding response OmpR family regulator